MHSLRLDSKYSCHHLLPRIGYLDRSLVASITRCHNTSLVLFAATQKLLYPYLPEPMRNAETFEWMLNNPEYRAQLETMLQQQVRACKVTVPRE